MTVSVASLQFALKTLWPQNRIEDEVYPTHPFLALIPKMTDFQGENLYVALQTGDPQGRSADFTTAQTTSGLTGAGGSSRGKRFLMTRVKDYQIIQLETEVMMASEGKEGALVKALDTEMRSGIRNLSKSLATALFRGQSGAISTIGQITATTITLGNINDVTSFEVGMILVSAPTVTALNYTTPATATITGVNRDTGVLTFGAGTFTGTNWIAGTGILFAAGDNANNSGTFYKVAGLADWIPSATPSATPFFGVDRTEDPTRLAGLRIDASGLNPEEALTLSLSRQDREGGSPSHMMVNHADFRNIGFALGSKVETVYQKVGSIGFKTYQIQGPKGIVDIVADQDCPAGIGYSLDLSTWKLATLGACPQIQDRDGSTLSRVYNRDAYEARLMYYGNVYCVAPGYNAVITLPT